MISKTTLVLSAIFYVLYNFLKRRTRRKSLLLKNIKYSDRSVIVTGASGGIGREICRIYHKIGYKKIYALDIDKKALDKLEIELPSVVPIVVNLADSSSIHSAVDKMDLETVDILVNNAGIVSGKPFTELTDDDISKTIDINAKSHLILTRRILKNASHLKHIVSISSAAGLYGCVNLVDYCSSKYAVKGFADALRLELSYLKSPTKISVVCPGHVSTELFKGFYIPISPSLTPISVAEEVVLASLGSSSIVVTMPWSVWLGYIQSAILPVAVFDFLMGIMGIGSAMAKFDPKRSQSIFNKIK